MNDVPAISRIHGIHKPYVAIAEVEDYLRLGWMVLPPRGSWRPREESVHLVWVCHCKMVVPVK